MDIMTFDQIEAVAPAAFATGNDDMSDRYKGISTPGVLNLLGERGFYPVQAKQDRPYKKDPAFVRHSIILRHSDHLKQTEGSVPQLIITNSHNGQTKLDMRAGLYRFICANGLVVGRDALRRKVPHVGQMAEEVHRYVSDFVLELDQIEAAQKLWAQTKLTKRRKTAFAKKAGALRFGDQLAAYALEDILKPRRAEDEGDDLWSVYNVIQENITKGGFIGKNTNDRQIRARALTGITPDLEFNSQLWAMAEKYAA